MPSPFFRNSPLPLPCSLNREAIEMLQERSVVVSYMAPPKRHVSNFRFPSQVYVSNNRANVAQDAVPCGNLSTFDIATGTQFDLVCNDGDRVRGRYVVLELRDYTGVLQVCEIQVTSSPTYVSTANVCSVRSRSFCTILLSRFCSEFAELHSHARSMFFAVKSTYKSVTLHSKAFSIFLSWT